MRMRDFSLIKQARMLLGYTQTELAYRSGTSLPTIQTIEAGKANPSIDILERIAVILGLKLTLESQSANWDVLAHLGVPLIARDRSLAIKPSSKTLYKCLQEASLELITNDVIEDKERKVEAIQALLLALASHFPDTFEKFCKSAPLISRLLPTRLTGRLIRLKRQAVALLATYL